MAEKSKNLKALKGVLADTTSKAGKKLPEITVKKIIDFYNSDYCSRMMPGMKDVVYVKVDGKRSLVQKRLLLFNLKDLYTHYKELNAHKVSFSKFAQLRPKECVLAGASGTHSVCVCTIHQNCELMLEAINLNELTK